MRKKNVLIIIIVVLATVLSVLAIVSCVPKGGDANASSESLNVSRNLLYGMTYVSTTSEYQSVTTNFQNTQDPNFEITITRYANTGNVWSIFHVGIEALNGEQVCLSANVRNRYGTVSAVPVSVVFASTYTTTAVVSSGGLDIAIRVGEDVQGIFDARYTINDIRINKGSIPSDVYFPYMLEDTFNRNISLLGGLDYETGYQNGLIDNSMLQHERNIAYNNGWNVGNTVGYARGYDEGRIAGDGAVYNDVTGVNAVIGLLGGINEALQVNIFGTFSIYDLLGIVIAFFLFFGFLRLFKG